MKRIALFTGSAVAIYLAGYVAVRHLNHLSGTQLVPDAQGAYHSQPLSDTRLYMVLPGSSRLMLAEKLEF